LTPFFTIKGIYYLLFIYIYFGLGPWAENKCCIISNFFKLIISSTFHCKHKTKKLKQKDESFVLNSNVN